MLIILISKRNPNLRVRSTLSWLVLPVILSPARSLPLVGGSRDAGGFLLLSIITECSCISVQQISPPGKMNPVRFCPCSRWHFRCLGCAAPTGSHVVQLDPAERRVTKGRFTSSNSGVGFCYLLDFPLPLCTPWLRSSISLHLLH